MAVVKANWNNEPYRNPNVIESQYSQGAISIINENPLDVVEKVGKYQFVYDYDATPQPIIYDLLPKYSIENTIKATPNTNTNSSGWADILKSITPQNISFGATSPYYVQPTVNINPNPQVGVFSKGNVVNVIRFDVNYAFIENPNYVEGQKTTNSGGFNWLLIGNAVNMKEFNIPKEYLSKVDESTPITVSTGINFGANMKPQPVYNIPPVETMPNQVSHKNIEENASFILNRDFQYVSGGRSGSESCPMCENYTPIYSILKAGTKVTGLLFREADNTAYKLQAGAITPPNYKDYLEVKGYGTQGFINIPIEYLTRDVQTNSSSVVPVKNNDKNILMIAGAFLVGYLLFNKGND